MEPTVHLPGEEAGTATLAPVGELIVQSGRQAGARRALADPLTLIGRAPGCDVRLNVEAVSSLHCVLVAGPTGVVLRDLGSAEGTWVNQQRVVSCVLHDGDVLSIGPFQFKLRLPERLAAEPIAVERDALRVQAAAVAAQQAALTEEEVRLEQRRAELERQEKQLSEHLAQRHAFLTEWEEKLADQARQLDEEQAKFARECEETRQQLESQQTEATLLAEKARQDRARLFALQRRLRKRWHTHWDVKEAELRKREQAVAAATQRQIKEQERLHARRLKLNTDVELGRRQMQEGWTQLRQAQMAWELRRQQENLQLEQQRQALVNREAEFAWQRQSLAAQVRNLESARTRLAREVDGLETRSRNLRRKVGELERETSRLEAVIRPLPPPLPERVAQPVQAEPLPRLLKLEQLAGNVADQRLHLLEQWERLLQAQEAWKRDHADLVPQLEQAAQRLSQREEQLEERERRLSERALALERERRELVRMRAEVEARQARLNSLESSWQQQREVLLAQVQAREILAERAQVSAEQAGRRWLERRQQDTLRAQEELARLGELQRQYAELRDAQEKKLAEVQQAQRELAEARLAMEQLRQELLGQSTNSAASDKRLQRLVQQYAGLYAETAREIQEGRRHLNAEAERLNGLARHLHLKAENLLSRERTLAGQLADWERKQLQAEQSQVRLQQELHRLRQEQEAREHHFKNLQDEVERLARLMLDEGSEPEPEISAARAA